MENVWCENCIYFKPIDMGGEGVCKAPHPRNDAWYGHHACASFEANEFFVQAVKQFAKETDNG